MAQILKFVYALIIFLSLFFVVINGGMSFFPTFPNLSYKLYYISV